MPTFDDPLVERIYQDGLRRIARVRARLRFDEHGVLIVPTVCGLCEQPAIELAMVADGDGLPICKKCFEGCVEAMGGVAEPYG